MEIKKRVKTVEPTKDNGIPKITKQYLKDLCESLEMYTTPHLNDSLYLSNKGFNKIENLEDYYNLKALYFDNNAFAKIENLDKLTELRCLYLHNNAIDRIEGLDALHHLNTLNLAHNKIRRVENLGMLYELNNLNLGYNNLTDKESLEGLLDCPHLTQLNLESNQLSLDEADLYSVLSRLSGLKVLYLKGNPLVAKIRHYRKRVIAELQTLTYLDDRPVNDEERRLALQWMRGGEVEEQAERARIKAEKEKRHKNYIEEIRQARQETKNRRKEHLVHYKAQLEQENRRNIQDKEARVYELSEAQETYYDRLEQEGYKASEAKEDDETAIQSGKYKIDMLDRSIKANDMQIKLIDDAIVNIDNEVEVKQPEPSIDSVSSEIDLELIDVEKLLGDKEECRDDCLEWTKQVDLELQRTLEECEFDFERAARVLNDRFKNNVDLSEEQVRKRWTHICVRKVERAKDMEELD